MTISAQFQLLHLLNHDEQYTESVYCSTKIEVLLLLKHNYSVTIVTKLLFGQLLLVTKHVTSYITSYCQVTSYVT